MNRSAAYIVISAIIFAMAFLLGRYYETHTYVPDTAYQDTLRFAILELQHEILSLKEQRSLVAQDTQRINLKYEDLLLRINADRSDSAQLALLRMLLNKPNPQPIDINQEIVQGQRCCELLDNNREQLKLCDSASVLKDSSITLLTVDINQCKDGLLASQVENAAMKADNAKELKQKKAWRKAALFEGLLIIIEGTRIFLSQ
jgi:hypothetical protein